MELVRRVELWCHSFFLFISLLQGAITQLSEQISTLNEKMDEFTSRIEELNCKFTARRVPGSQQNLAVQAEAASNGHAPTPVLMTGMANGVLTGSLLPHSSSSSQLARDSPLMEEVSGNHFLLFGACNVFLFLFLQLCWVRRLKKIAVNKLGQWD